MRAFTVLHADHGLLAVEVQAVQPSLPADPAFLDAAVRIARVPEVRCVDPAEAGSMASPTRKARFTSFVQTDACRPYFVSFALLITSSSGCQTAPR